MKTRKMIAGLLAAATAVTMAASVIVTAADSIGVTISSTKAKAGEDFTLTVDISGIPSAGMNGADFGIQYDSSVVSITSVTKGEIVKEVPSSEATVSDPLTVYTESKGMIGVLYGVAETSSDYWVTEDGTFLVIKGKVSADAKAGDKSEFEIVGNHRNDNPTSSTAAKPYFGTIDAGDNVVDFTAVPKSGVVEVVGEGIDLPTDAPTDKPTDAPTAPTIDGTLPDSDDYGNVDCDKNHTVDSLDVVKLNMYLLDPVKYPLSAQGMANADVERDNKIDMVDSGKVVNCAAEIIKRDVLGKKS